MHLAGLNLPLAQVDTGGKNYYSGFTLPKKDFSPSATLWEVKMKIEIQQQEPDGINLSVSDLIVNDLNEANKFIKFVMTTWGTKRINISECEKIFKEINVSEV